MRNSQFILKLSLLFLAYFSCLTFYSCKNTKRIFSASPDRKEKLIQEILFQEELYCDGDPISNTYLIANDFVQPGKKYFSFDNKEILSIKEDSIQNKQSNKIYFFLKQSNLDSTLTTIDVLYYACYTYKIPNIVKYQIIPTMISYFKFAYNPLSNKWVKLKTHWEYWK